MTFRQLIEKIEQECQNRLVKVNFEIPNPVDPNASIYSDPGGVYYNTGTLKSDKEILTVLRSFGIPDDANLTHINII